MSVLPAPFIPSRFLRSWEIASDLLIATALIWTLPLLLGGARMLAMLLLGKE